MGAIQQVLLGCQRDKGWKTVTYPAGTNNWCGLCISDDGTKIVAMAYQSGAGAPDSGFLYVSTDSGITWNVRQADNLFYSVAMAPNGSFIIFSLSNNGITSTYSSTDLGITRTNLGVAYLNNFKVINNSGKIFATTSSGIYYSSNYGVSWTRGLGQPSIQPNAYSVSDDGSKVFVSYDNSNPSQYYSSNDGVTFTAKNGSYPSVLSAEISNDGTKFALARPFSSSAFFIYSPDSWATVLKPAIPSGVSYFNKLQFSDDGNTLYALCSLSSSPNYRIFTTTDGGVTWNTLAGSDGLAIQDHFTVKNGNISGCGTHLYFYN